MRLILTLLCLLVCALPTRAQELVDLELVLAVDASGSVDAAEYRLQIQGVADAFRDPEVLNAIRSGPNQRIAVSLFLWAEHNLPKQAMAWYAISTADEAEAFARDVETLPRKIAAGATGIGKAIQFGVWQIEGNGYQGLRQVIDVSGDGEESPPQEYTVLLNQGRTFALNRGVVINGLPIQTSDNDLDKYYASRVIGGPAAFAEPAYGFEDFARAIRTKLIREVRYRPAIGMLAD